MSDETTRIIRRPITPVPPNLIPPPILVAAWEDEARARENRSPDDPGPTVGWLVILEGPGRGQSLTLGHGMNQIGRSATNRVVLDFGDDDVSRKAHATITYDPRGRKFYVQPGPEATHLTYLGVEPDLRPVLIPTELGHGARLTLGRTKLKFIALCGPGFTWD